jgi:hypothetical protein
VFVKQVALVRGACAIASLGSTKDRPSVASLLSAFISDRTDATVASALVTELLPERTQALLRGVRETQVGEPQQVMAAISTMVSTSASAGDLTSLGNFALGAFDGVSSRGYVARALCTLALLHLQHTCGVLSLIIQPRAKVWALCP